MKIQLSNGIATAAIDPVGAELKSFHDSVEELIWAGDPAIWSGSAPILFPVIGRTRNGVCRWRGRDWEMPKHGLIRTRTWTLAESGPGFARLTFAADDETRRHYPAEFAFAATFRLEANALRVSYDIANNGSETMLFSVGSHPGIALPFDGTRLEDYYLEMTCRPGCAIHRLTSAGLLAARPEKTPAGPFRLQLEADTFAADALFLLGAAPGEVKVANDRTGRVVTVATGDAPDLGLWARPGAPYICIEPWYGYDDPEDHDGLLEHKPGIRTLAPGETFSCFYRISASRR